MSLNISDCPLIGALSLYAGGPMAIADNTTYSYYDNMFLQSYNLFRRFLHEERKPSPGIWINGVQYCLNLYFEESFSNADVVYNVTSSMIEKDQVDFFLSPYTSTLTSQVLAASDPAMYIAFASGAASTPMFSSYNYGFGMVAPAAKTLIAALRMLYYNGARTISYLYEDTAYTSLVCGAISDIIVDEELDGMSVVFSQQVPATADVTFIDPVIANFSSVPVDVMIGCTYYSACLTTIDSMKSHGFEPNALIFTSCATLPTYPDDTGDDGIGVLTDVQWAPEMDYLDEVTGWTSMDFYNNFTTWSDDGATTPTDLAAAAFASLISLTIAIERAGSIDTLDVALELAKLRLDTLYGPVEFDENNQNLLEVAFIQMNEDLEPVLVTPDSVATGALVYPMISWSTRACWDLHGSGACICDVNCPACTSSNVGYSLSSCDAGSGLVKVSHFFLSLETCRTDLYSLPSDEYVSCGYLSVASSTGISVIFLTTLVALLGLISLIWIVVHRKSKIITANQPIFLSLFCFGIVALSLNCITFVGKPSIPLCESQISLLTLGFSLMFGSLLCLIYRVWRIFDNEKLVRVRVRERDVVKGLVFLLAIDIIMLMVWLPLFPTKVSKVDHLDDVGIDYRCSFDTGIVSLVLAFKFIEMVSGCYLSYKTRNVDRRYMQSHLIMNAVFNLTIIWLLFVIVNLLKISSESISITSVFAILASCVVGLVFVIAPKMYMHYRQELDQDSAAGNALNARGGRSVSASTIGGKLKSSTVSYISNSIALVDDSSMLSLQARLRFDATHGSSATMTSTVEDRDTGAMASTAELMSQNQFANLIFSSFNVMHLLDQIATSEDKYMKLREDIDVLVEENEVLKLEIARLALVQDDSDDNLRASRSSNMNPDSWLGRISRPSVVARKSPN